MHQWHLRHFISECIITWTRVIKVFNRMSNFGALLPLSLEEIQASDPSIDLSRWEHVNYIEPGNMHSSRKGSAVSIALLSGRNVRHEIEAFESAERCRNTTTWAISITSQGGFWD